jgi:hypothetical protein
VRELPSFNFCAVILITPPVAPFLSKYLSCRWNYFQKLNIVRSTIKDLITFITAISMDYISSVRINCLVWVKLPPYTSFIAEEYILYLSTLHTFRGSTFHIRASNAYSFLSLLHLSIFTSMIICFVINRPKRGRLLVQWCCLLMFWRLLTNSLGLMCLRVHTE